MPARDNQVRVWQLVLCEAKFAASSGLGMHSTAQHHHAATLTEVTTGPDTGPSTGILKALAYLGFPGNHKLQPWAPQSRLEALVPSTQVHVVAVVDAVGTRAPITICALQLGITV